MKLKIIIFLLIIVGVIAVYAFVAVETASAPVVIVHMGLLAYAPDRITIKQGDTIQFVNDSTEERWPASNIHPTHEIYSAFDPKKSIMPSKLWSFRFDEAGIWQCHDHIEPKITCRVTVE